jgi:hypothetical protein
MQALIEQNRISPTARGGTFSAKTQRKSKPNFRAGAKDHFSKVRGKFGSLWRHTDFTSCPQRLADLIANIGTSR